jgi:hypothetical protein
MKFRDDAFLFHLSLVYVCVSSLVEGNGALPSHVVVVLSWLVSPARFLLFSAYSVMMLRYRVKAGEEGGEYYGREKSDELRLCCVQNVHFSLVPQRDYDVDLGEMASEKKNPKPVSARFWLAPRASRLSFSITIGPLQLSFPQLRCPFSPKLVQKTTITTKNCERSVRCAHVVSLSFLLSRLPFCNVLSIPCLCVCVCVRFVYADDCTGWSP